MSIIETAMKESESTINFKVPKELHTAIKLHAIQSGTTIRALAIRLFEKELARSKESE